MIQTLTPGANATLPEQQICHWQLTLSNTAALSTCGLAIIPADAQKHPVGDAAYLHHAQPWITWSDHEAGVAARLDLSSLPQGCQRLLLVLYRYQAAGPISNAEALQLQINPDIHYSLALTGYGDAAMVIAEFYWREHWRLRALAEASAYGLAALGRRLNVTLDERDPQAAPGSDGAGQPEAVTGSAFAISTTHLLTCAHVIEDMRTLNLAALGGRYAAEAVLVDNHNDIALLRIREAPALTPLGFRNPAGELLGESIITLGFPLSGLSGEGVQITQGVVSGLLGIHNDSRHLQLTAPIQPGSSGGAVIDGRGGVTGMVRSSVSGTQNMNFAVKSALLIAFLEAAQIEPRLCDPLAPSKNTPQLVRETQAALWRLEASRR